MEWGEVLKQLRREERAVLKREGVKGRYTKKKISLASALTDEPLKVFGDYLGVAKIVGTSSISVKLDNKHGTPIDLREVAEIESPFGVLYITTDGADATGYITIYFGGDLTARIKPKENKVSIRNTAGSDVDLLTEAAFNSKFNSHAGEHSVNALGVADTAERIMAASTKVKWAIIHTDLAIRWGFTSTVHRTGPIGGLVAADGDLSVEFCDLYEIYFNNNVAGETPKLQIEYVEEA